MMPTLFPGHVVNIEAPEHFDRELRTFLRSLPVGPL